MQKTSSGHFIFYTIGMSRKYSEMWIWDFVRGTLAVEIPLYQIEWSLSAWQCNKNFSSIVPENGFTEYYFEGSYIADIRKTFFIEIEKNEILQGYCVNSNS